MRSHMRGRGGIGDLVDGLPKARAALAYAEQQHAGQRRSVDGAPFIRHPIEVATLLCCAGAPDHVIAAGLLHDVIEDTPVEVAELRKRFGAPVAALVLAVSEDKTIAGYQARKAALRRQVAAAGNEALMVFAADKVSKARELQLTPSGAARSRNEMPRSRRRKLIHYRRSAELIEDLLAHSPLASQLRSELELLASTEPSRSSGVRAA